MKILVACEESQSVTKQLRKLNHEAYSCDIIPCSGGHPEWHLQVDARELLKMKWDMILVFPPCTFLTNAGSVRMRVNGKINRERYNKMLDAKEFFMLFYNADCEKIAIENPTPMKICGLPQYTQIIQPWMFGSKYSKRTCLWLKGLPPLVPDIYRKPSYVVPFINGGCKDSNGNYRKLQGRKERDSLSRSKTFSCVAKAMSIQWAGDNR